MCRRSVACVATTLAFFHVRTAWAVDPFEIQVYDGSANPTGVPGLELHLNTVPNGRRTAVSPELPQHHQSHATLEPSLGVAPWWELGAYFQTALQGDGSFAYAGIKLRSKFVRPFGAEDPLRLGVNFELSLLPAAFDRERWGSEVRPIIGWDTARWSLIMNPIIDTGFSGPESKDGPSFEPAAMAKWKLFARVAVGVEYYANLGPIGSSAPLRAQEHYLFEAFDLLNVHRFELNGGLGEGLTAGSNALVVKVILGYAWDSN